MNTIAHYLLDDLRYLDEDRLKIMLKDYVIIQCISGIENDYYIIYSDNDQFHRKKCEGTLANILNNKYQLHYNSICDFYTVLLGLNQDRYIIQPRSDVSI